MKKAVVFVVLAMVLIGSCAAQSASNEAQRIVGTWTVEKSTSSNAWLATGNVLVFNANGTAVLNGINFNYGISTSGEISLISTVSTDKQTYKLFISPDGKRIIFSDLVVLQKK